MDGGDTHVLSLPFLTLEWQVGCGARRQGRNAKLGGALTAVQAGRAKRRSQGLPRLPQLRLLLLLSPLALRARHTGPAPCLRLVADERHDSVARLWPRHLPWPPRPHKCAACSAEAGQG